MRSDSDNYFQCFSLYTERFTVDVTDGINGYLSRVLNEIRNVLELEGEDTKATVTTDIGVIEMFLRSIDS